ncbi:MerR family DNA-binding transcriptional regulator [Paenibacillus paeoniae]|uniref:MerR family DNA-binding transcriptional regulator n=1 Tax=Paenibacillus paeoniae TaxID=2292705 RepID=A0A371PEX7_9BACL|nr:MerR family DNA-binding transcriptional regulator [Paenibacillus paeoniae]
MTIQDFSEWTGLPTSMLRHYDKEGLLHYQWMIPVVHG